MVMIIISSIVFAVKQGHETEATASPLLVLSFAEIAGSQQQLIVPQSVAAVHLLIRSSLRILCLSDELLAEGATSPPK